ncbi:TonB-dependent receptor domain-containing protein [Olivibacter jilunii]|uniref:TonB-dependent receptor domain-containing protein n=1 Tax=Olivibacter jilunii TaxID=985016 RepID=UPI003F17FA9B
MKNLYVLSFLLFFLSSSALAQEAQVSGQVYDSLSHSPISYASVSIHQNNHDSAFVDGVMTNESGAFSLAKLKAGQYLLKIRFLGYETQVIKLRPLHAGEHLAIKAIELKPSATFLNEVVVSAQPNLNYHKIDKQVYKANQFETAKGGTAIDIIKNMPSIAINGQGEITLRGSSGFLVLINGKAVQTDVQTILSQLPANVVENIELITAPSAKYDPDGKGGIINITTKTGVDNGSFLAINLQTGFPSFNDYNNKESQKRYGTDISFNYKNNRWDLTASANYLRNDNAGFREGDVYTIINQIKTTFPSNGERSFDKYNYGGRFNIEFKADEKNTFSIGFFAGHKFQDRVADIYYNNTKIDLENQQVIGRTSYFNANLQTKQGNFVLGNFGYTHQFNDRSNLSLSLLYEYADLYGSTDNKNIEGNTTVQHTLNTYKNPLKGLRAKLDYSVKIGEGSWESGYQFREDKQNGDFIYSTKQGDTFVVDPEFSGLIDARNSIHSLYSQYAGKHKKFEYTGGLRYEHANRNVNLRGEEAPHVLTLDNLFPSANILYTLSSGWQTKAGVSRRVQRTNNFELNPIPEREHSETLEQGDADLLPEFIYLAELGLIKTFKKGSFFSTLYYQDIKNPIQRVNSVYTDTILNRIYTNAGKAYSYGLETGINTQITKQWQIYLGANLYKYHIKGTLFDEQIDVANSDWVYAINFNTDYKINSTLNVQGNLNYLSARPTAQGRDSRFISPNLALKKTFMNGRFSAQLQWQNIDLGFIQANEQRITTFGSDFYTTTNYIYEKDVLLLNLSFQLNKLKNKLKLPESEFGNKEF